MKFIKILLSILLFNSTVLSFSIAEEVEKPIPSFKFNSSLPLEIKSEELNIEQNTGKATFSGSVMATQGNLILTAVTIVVEYALKNSRMTSEMKKLTANKDVTIVSDTQSAVANKVVYDIISENIIMTGDVILKEGLSATSGDKLTINLNTGSRRMEGNVRTLILSEEEDT
jgi:lipopolysaccharide export system protein LptA|tara:strand:- start:104 stop:616 length:513 start_codon:yes stop_codon:yes gene_type:complete